MTRTGVAIALALALAAIGLASIVRITGPSRVPTPSVAAAPAVGLLVPVVGVPRAALRDSWGEARGDGTRLHHAIDIMAPIGTAVVAAGEGRVEKLFTSDLGGLTIYERSADGRTIYYYAHLDRYAPTLAEGQPVRAGQTLGAVGASGDADPGAPHLHFEVHRMAPGQPWWQGAEVNPYSLLAHPA
ncbi:M23 family metallopeptidase [Sphingomonas sp.]|uniref:M23 family metallopeptidase n=1 Tax=Sphingomonas sp. TaxID=28214 RepID=UPI003B00BE89